MPATIRGERQYGNVVVQPRDAALMVEPRSSQERHNDCAGVMGPAYGYPMDGSLLHAALRNKRYVVWVLACTLHLYQADKPAAAMAW